MPMLTPEQQAREQIDRMLQAAGWLVQSYSGMNRTAGPGVAVCEFPLTTGPVDYLLFGDGRPIGVIEAKKAGTTLSGVEPQALRYGASLPGGMQPLAWHDPLPFRYESTGVETYFADDRDPDPRSREVFSFHRPETLMGWAGEPCTLRARLWELPPLDTTGLWKAQVEAIRNLEDSLAGDLLELPRRLAEYVVVHELLHLRVPHHNGVFRLLLRGYLADWQERERELGRWGVRWTGRNS